MENVICNKCGLEFPKHSLVQGDDVYTIVDNTSTVNVVMSPGGPVSSIILCNATCWPLWAVATKNALGSAMTSFLA
jgi:hypothetical protein